MPQAEGIAFSPDGTRLLVGSEQLPSPLLMFRLTTSDLFNIGIQAVAILKQYPDGGRTGREDPQ